MVILAKTAVDSLTSHNKMQVGGQRSLLKFRIFLTRLFMTPPENPSESRPGGCWYCFTGIDMNAGPEECGPRCVYSVTGLQPGQHSGWCCHGLIHVHVG
jgi:hypothetical protein